MNSHIRRYEPSDLAAVISLVHTDFATTTSNIPAFLEGATALVYDDGGIVGLVAATVPAGEAGKRPARVRIYTHPQRRRQGIAGQLWHEILPVLSASDATYIGTSYRCDRGDGSRFFADRGFKPWYQLHELIYTGPRFPEPEIEATHYEDRYFEDYLRLINDGFTDIRRDNNIEPNVIFGPESFNDGELRRQMLDNRDNLYVFFAGGEVIGLLELESGPEANSVDTLSVKSSHRGRGYGRAITQFGVNRMRDRGVEKVYIGVLGTNTAARRLYESLGCVLEQSLEMARLDPSALR